MLLPNSSGIVFLQLVQNLTLWLIKTRVTSKIQIVQIRVTRADNSSSLVTSSSRARAIVRIRATKIRKTRVLLVRADNSSSQTSLIAKTANGLKTLDEQYAAETWRIVFK